jgi:4-hydroxy-tetrahydrodipicolinate reductase
VARRHAPGSATVSQGDATWPCLGLEDPQADFGKWLDRHPVDALVDFSSPEAVMRYGPEVASRGLLLVTAISAYDDATMAYIRSLGTKARVVASPNVTLGINFLIMAARLLKNIAPFADVEVIEQHFRSKPEVSGTARKIADSLGLPEERITSLRLGGIVGHHEVVFGFPYQTVRLSHDSISRHAFGTGAAFLLGELAHRPPGFFTFEDLLMCRVRQDLLAA